MLKDAFAFAGGACSDERLQKRRRIKACQSKPAPHALNNKMVRTFPDYTGKANIRRTLSVPSLRSEVDDNTYYRKFRVREVMKSEVI